jgi:hypothetical protein
MTTTTVPMSHYCSASSAADRITRWDAEVCIYENGYMEETTLCPVCNSWVTIAIDMETIAQTETTSRWIAHDDNVIYGVGDSAEMARADARQWLDNDEEAVANLLCVRASELLYNEVVQHGGDCVFMITRQYSDEGRIIKRIDFAVTKEEWECLIDEE